MEKENPIVILDGIKTQIKPADLDGDGKTGGIESLDHPAIQSSVSHLQQKSELAESLDRLDSDEVDSKTQMTGIDFNANLNQIEKNGYGVLDFLVSTHWLTTEAQFLTRRFKRLSVSVGGLGRSQKVAMVTEERERQRGLGGSLIDKVKGFFGSESGGS